MAQIDKLFHILSERKGSDLHISVGAPPLIRISGDLTPVTSTILPQAETKKLLYEIMSPFQQKRFEEDKELDFAYSVSGIGRFRANIFMQNRGIAAVFRIIPEKILSAEQLKLPPQVLNFAKIYRGLVLCTGPTGSGKSTTLAALVDYVNINRAEHIITIEDPIEFVHENKKCLVNQREIGSHTESFSAALKSALREDPDVILVGEMRDLETISLALTAAETGHLVFGTLHTSSAAKTIDRIIDVFPSGQQGQVRSQLSEALKGVMAQTLMKKIGGGRIGAVEILVGNPAIGNLIREAKTFQIPSILQTSKSEGMQTLDMALYDLYQKKLITASDCIDRAADTKSMKAQLGVK
ncbi:type IV pilus twitching motility protein PilT [Candidatus Latescibacterota bacterium]